MSARAKQTFGGGSRRDFLYSWTPPGFAVMVVIAIKQIITKIMIKYE